MAKMGTKVRTRIVTGIDSVGDFFARVEMYNGFFQGWTKIDIYWSVGAYDPEVAISRAKDSIDKILLALSTARVIKYPENQ